jgi:NAD(P)-dependent dehydrogenase (short-subunit alcohol dehydrogenase family)
MKSDNQQVRICIFGASGGIGGALCEQIALSDCSARIYVGSRKAKAFEQENVTPFAFDLLDEQSIAASTNLIGNEGQLDLVIVATGLLQRDDIRPERSWKELDSSHLAAIFAVNTIGPALIAKHCLPLLRQTGRAVFAALSARVGSIEDNQLGGWHGYRASKAALNQLVRNFAIELARKNSEAIAVSLHPGTVDTNLSKPFQRGLPSGQPFSPYTSATNLLKVIGQLKPQHSGHLIAWDGSRIQY